MFRDLRFDTRITVINGYRDDIGFVRCDLRDGVVDLTGEVWTNNFKLSQCLMGGSITPAARFLIRVDSCQVTGQVSTRWYRDMVLAVVGCTFQGDGTGYGIRGGGAAGYAVGNIVRGYTTGIAVGGQEDGAADNNVVEDCSGAGLICGGSYSGYVRNNVVRRCGRGIEGGGDRHGSVSGNTVSDCTGTGLRVSSESFDVVGNVVSRSGGDGILVWGSGRVLGNTSCLNDGSGFVSDHYYDGYQTEFTRNVGYGNGSYGIQWQSTDPATVTCNDWYANQAGTSGGWPPSAEDFLEDPQFCDAQAGDFHLRADSPLLDRAGCGQVGALGVGCGPPVGVIEAAPTLAGFALARLGPVPTTGRIALELTLPRTAAIEVTVHDVQGRTVARLAGGEWSAGRHAIEWNGEGARGRAAPGLYLIRYRFPGGQDSRRIVISR
jgi:hypothetical protein